MLPYKLIDNIKQQDEKLLLKKKKKKASPTFSHICLKPLYLLFFKTYLKSVLVNTIQHKIL